VTNPIRTAQPRAPPARPLKTVCCGILWFMSKLLQQAIEKVRELPEDEQEMAAVELIGYLSDFPTSEERSVITEGRSAYERREFIPLDQWRHDMGLGNN
jgi:hypothetical protein